MAASVDVPCPLCGELVTVSVTLRATRVGYPEVGADGVQRLPVVVAVRPGQIVEHTPAPARRPASSSPPERNRHPMSYSFSPLKPVRPVDLHDALIDARLAQLNAGAAYSPEAMTASLEAIAAASELAQAGVLGGPDDLVRCMISGHSNPSHEPAPGWAGDSLTIALHRATS